MSYMRSPLVPALLIFALALVQACGADEQAATPKPGNEAPEPTHSAHEEGAPGPEIAMADAAAVEEDGASDDISPVTPDAEPVPEESLDLAGEIELKQYTVAYIGSGSMGSGTLTIEGKVYPFKIAGLGVGGFGASAMDATGEVYNLPSIEAFPGTYGNARLGMTAGESGGGKLWLRNPDGVVLALESEMRGLALGAGVDGILIQWDEEEETGVDRAVDNTEEAVGKGIEAGADAVEKGIDNVKGWFDSD